MLKCFYCATEVPAGEMHECDVFANLHERRMIEAENSELKSQLAELETIAEGLSSEIEFSGPIDEFKSESLIKYAAYRQKWQGEKGE